MEGDAEKVPGRRKRVAVAGCKCHDLARGEGLEGVP